MPLAPDMIPESLRPWLSDVAYRMKCPLDFIASTASSNAIGTDRNPANHQTQNPRRLDRCTESLGSRYWRSLLHENPVHYNVLKPLDRLIAAAHIEFEDRLAQYERAVIEYEAQKKAYAKQELERHGGKRIENTVSYPEAPVKPKERRYMVNDTTVEKLADLLNENPTGLLQMRDELTGLLASWDRAGHEQDRAFHLEAWNGYGSITIDRIGRGTTHVNIICESLIRRHSAR